MVEWYFDTPKKYENRKNENTVKLRYNEIHGDREKFRCSENFVVAEKSVNKENRAGV